MIVESQGPGVIRQRVAMHVDCLVRDARVRNQGLGFVQDWSEICNQVYVDDVQVCEYVVAVLENLMVQWEAVGLSLFVDHLGTIQDRGL